MQKMNKCVKVISVDAEELFDKFNFYLWFREK